MGNKDLENTNLDHQDLNRNNAKALEKVIVVKGLQKTYGKLQAVRGIDLEIAQGEIFGLIGPD